jgi:hypothetical protein
MHTCQAGYDGTSPTTSKRYKEEQVKLGRLWLLMMLVVAAGLAQAASAGTGEPPKTEYTYYEHGWELIQPGYEAKTGAAFHYWDWVWWQVTESEDPRFDGSEYTGPGRVNCLWSRWIDPAGTCTGGGDIVIIPGSHTEKPEGYTDYWEGRFWCPPNRYCKATLHGHGAFEGLQAVQGVVAYTDQATVVQGVVIGH